MKVKSVIEILQKMPPDAELEINDNNSGEIYSINGTDYINHFTAEEMSDDHDIVMIQVNCD